ncbi:MAG: hypothetical protein U9N35_03035 [Euryarchaeota archaeon]|nr:hypothetical protein [Euryarchaeota archaeon]
MKKNRKIVGTMAVIAVIVGMLMVSVPADKEEEKENECGCGYNSAPAEGKPLNFNELLEKTKGWEEEVALLEEQIDEKREKLLELYKTTKEGVYWKEIEDLQAKIGKLEGEYWYKKEVLFEMGVLRKYTELQRDGALKIVKETLPEIKDLEVAKALNAFEMIGEEKMKKERELEGLLTEAKNGRNFSKGIESLQREINVLDKEYWRLRKAYLRLYTIKTLERSRSLTLINHCYSGWCLPSTDPLDDSYPLRFKNFRQIKVWIGMYDKTSPFDPNADMIDEYCTTYFTTNTKYYWNKAKNKNPGTKSIQVKWFYFATCNVDNQRHDMIWEKNRNKWGAWSKPGYADYVTTSPSNGYYGFSTFANHHACCYWSVCEWCNTHCGTCFGCDKTRAQYFVTDNA